jgi:hypothetical protein
MCDLLNPLPTSPEAGAADFAAVALERERAHPSEPQVARRWAVRRACIRPRTLLRALLLTELLAGCGGGGGGGVGGGAQSGMAISEDLIAPLVPPAWSGHYVGAVTIAAVTYFGDAVFTQDGEVRLYVGGPYDNGGELQLVRPESSEQFVGTVEMDEGQLSGSGLILGQECAISAANRFCGSPAPAEISATVQLNTDGSGSSVLRGELRVTTLSDTETWPLNLRLWSDSLLARSAATAGQYQEVLAEFASAGEVIINIDSSGKLFFQSANSACIGNGALVPHLNGAADTYDVTLMMQNCNGGYAYLNGPYEGLALYSASSYWDYDSELRMWLSKPAGETPPAALTMLAQPL